jgi:hypothetical protein
MLQVNRRHLISRLGLAFFTLPPNYSILLHREIWSLCQFGNGFIWGDVYRMPTHWRRFYLNELMELKKKEKEENDKANAKIKSNNSKVKMRR